MSKLIVMLTHNDETVSNALSVFESCKDLPVDDWGFKNVGLPLEQMKSVVSAMRRAGKTTFLEVVTLSEQECLEGASMAVKCGFDYLLGTVFYPSVVDYAKAHHLRYLPFCGKVSGHPSILGGTAEEIITDVQRFQSAGCQGTDLLAYRHTEDPERIMRLLVKRVSFPIVVAGSINSFDRIATVMEVNPWMFTIGSALFEGRFGDKKGFRDQLQAVVDFMKTRA